MTFNELDDDVMDVTAQYALYRLIIANNEETLLLLLLSIKYALKRSSIFFYYIEIMWRKTARSVVCNRG